MCHDKCSVGPSVNINVTNVRGGGGCAPCAAGGGAMFAATGAGGFNFASTGFNGAGFGGQFAAMGFGGMGASGFGATGGSAYDQLGNSLTMAGMLTGNCGLAQAGQMISGLDGNSGGCPCCDQGCDPSSGGGQFSATTTNISF